MSEQDKARKQFLAKSIDVDSDERSLTAVITTGTVDRDNEVLLSKGADFEDFLKNPVVLWAHNYSEPPIGRALWIKKGRNRLTAKMKFAETDRAEEVYQLYKAGFLNAFSVGFQPKSWHEPTPEEIKKNADWANASRIYDEWEMFEYSGVPVPANPEALAVAVKTKEISLSPDTCEQLGIEQETVYVASGGAVDLTKAQDDDKAEAKPNEAPIITAPYIRTDKYVQTERQGAAEDIVNVVVKKLKGKMF